MPPLDGIGQCLQRGLGGFQRSAVGGDAAQPRLDLAQQGAACAGVADDFSGSVQRGGESGGSGNFVVDDGLVGALGAGLDGVGGVADGHLAGIQLGHPVGQASRIRGAAEQVLVNGVHQLGVVQASVQGVVFSGLGEGVQQIARAAST